MAIGFVLFDLVGTLLDERSDHEALDGIMAEVVTRYGLAESAADLAGRFSLVLMEIIGAEPHMEVDEPPADFVTFESAAPDIFAGLLETLDVRVGETDKAWFWSRYLDIQRTVWRAYDDAAPMLRRLRDDGHQIGVLTDADRYMVDDILPRTTISGLIDVAVAAMDVGHVKPHPAPFLAAMKQASVGPEATAMVGDSYERDVLGAQAAGIHQAILLDRHDARRVPVPRIQRLDQLEGVLQRA